MATRSKTLSISKKITALETKLGLDPQAGQGSPLPLNTRANRKELVRLVHYTYLLHCLTNETLHSKKARHYMALAEDLQKQELADNPPRNRRELEALQREQTELLLVEAHSHAWSMALNLYEKGSKELCQMMISLMDELLQNRAGESVLYPNGRPNGTMTLAQELENLNREYLSSYKFLCTYDFCVGKLADFVKVPEYRLLVREHERIISNGLPAKVGEALSRLNQSGLTLNLPDSINEPFMEQCYQWTVEELGGEAAAMSDFVNLLVLTDWKYQREV